jgi:histidine triad (HIT) family protein
LALAKRTPPRRADKRKYNGGVNILLPHNEDKRRIIMDCIFCKIVNGEIPSNKVYEDDTVLAFHDIAPQMPVHVIVIPKMHIDSAFGVNEENSAVIGHIFEVIAKIAKDLGLDNGFRVINNCGEDGGQTVKHIHFHILGGEKLGEKLVK